MITEQQAPVPTARHDPGLTPDQVPDIAAALSADDLDRATATVAPLYAVDVAALLNQLGPAQRAALIERLRGRLDAEVLASLDASVREEVIDQLGPREVAEAVSELATDDAVEVLADLEPEMRESV